MSAIEIKADGTTGTIILYSLLLPMMILFSVIAYISSNTGMFLMTAALVAVIPFEIKRHIKLRAISKSPLIKFSDKLLYVRKRWKIDASLIEYGEIASFLRIRDGNSGRTSFSLKLKSGKQFEFPDSYRDHEARAIMDALKKKLPHLRPKYGWETKQISEYA